MAYINMSFELKFNNKDYKFKAFDTDTLMKLQVIGLDGLLSGVTDETSIADTFGLIGKLPKLLDLVYIGEEEQQFNKWRISELMQFFFAFQPFMMANLMGPYFVTQMKEVDLEKKKQEVMSVIKNSSSPLSTMEQP